MVTAPFVLGQPDAQTNWLVRGMNRPQGVAIAGGKLFVADTDDLRVLVWNAWPTETYQQPDMVLGLEQLSIQSSNVYYLPTALVYPKRLASDGTRLIVGCDGQFSNRLVFYNQLPTANNARNSFLIDPGSPPSGAAARTFSGAAPLLAGGHLYLSDRGYNRMLMWDAIPTASADATRAIGQANISSSMANPGGVSLSTFNGPDGTPSSDGTRLFVPDSMNHRVLFWDTLPSMNVAADHVLGQANASGNSVNRSGAADLGTMSDPSGASVASNRLAVADRGNHRVLLWNTVPTATGQSADLVLGQPNAASVLPNQLGLSASSMNRPHSVATDGTHVAVADTDNHRILLWNSWPASNFAPADVILGQPGPTRNVQQARTPSVERFLYPVAVTRAGNQLIVADRDVHRVLIWPRLPTLASEQPTVVLGQIDFAARNPNAGGGVTATGFDRPHAVSSDGTILAVADTDNNRVLIWKSIPTQIQQPADLVLGQPNLTSDTYNNGGAARGLDVPTGVFVRNGRIYVADTDNDRVLIWKTIPTQNHQAPDIVLGQADFSGITANRGAPLSNLGMARPTAVYADDSHIYVSDNDNVRMLVWNTLEPTNGQAANNVLGQANFGSNTIFFPPTTSTMYKPGGMDVFAGKLYVADAGYNRVSIFSMIPDRMGQAANDVLGQTSLTSDTANSGGISATSLQAPTSILVTEIGIYIADSANHRVVVLPPPTQ